MGRQDDGVAGGRQERGSDRCFPTANRLDFAWSAVTGHEHLRAKQRGGGLGPSTVSPASERLRSRYWFDRLKKGGRVDQDRNHAASRRPIGSFSPLPGSSWRMLFASGAVGRVFSSEQGRSGGRAGRASRSQRGFYPSIPANRERTPDFEVSQVKVRRRSYFWVKLGWLLLCKSRSIGNIASSCSGWSHGVCCLPRQSAPWFQSNPPRGLRLIEPQVAFQISFPLSWAGFIRQQKAGIESIEPKLQSGLGRMSTH